MNIPQNALYNLADMSGLHIDKLKTKLNGNGTLRVPISEKVRLSCPLAIVASAHKAKHQQAAILVHVRADLYMLLTDHYDFDLRTAHLIDASKCSFKMTDIFKGTNAVHQAIDKVADATVGIYKHEKNKWEKMLAKADSVAESTD